MLDSFVEHIKSTGLFNKEDKIILAVSGGKDSMLMLNLFMKANFNIIVAHCNFNLRGDQSNLDEQLVQEIAIKNDILFLKKSFNTKEFANKNNLSTQMAARELRYSWFEEIRDENKAKFVATAHHKNDVAETMLFNLTKGTGLSGLHGIVQKNNKVIRPLLCFSREQIDKYVDQNNLEYREDQSNRDTKYTRNLIRHNVIPELEKINPSLITTLNETAERLFDVEKIVGDKIEEELNKCVKIEGDRTFFNIELLQQLNPIATYLFYFLKDYGFNASDVNNIIHSFTSLSGKEFYSNKYKILRDRDYLILLKNKETEQEELTINVVNDFKERANISAEIKVNSEALKITKTSDFAHLDFDKLEFPLRLRKWKDGDFFYPFGMNGKKKLSDFFVDNKLSVIKKQETWILTCQDEIVWVVGQRIDDRYKISQETTNVLILSIKSK